MIVPVAVHHAGHRLTGFSRPGEAWATAACRIGLVRAPDELAAADLSGEVKEFVRDPLAWVTLRPMTAGDLPLLTRWRQQPHVLEWWREQQPPSLESVTAEHRPALEGREPTYLWIVEANGRSVGFCQDYLLRDHPDYPVVTPDPDAVGVDYLVGEPAFVGRGIGTRMLWAWAVHAHRRYPDVRTLFAAPDHRNVASLRVLEKVGFAQGVWFDEPQPDGRVDTVIGCTLDVGRVLG